MKTVLGSIAGLASMFFLAACTSSGGSTGGEIMGKIWGRTSLDGAAPVTGSFITAGFTQDEKMAGSGGCNSYSTTYNVNGSNIEIKTPVASTMMACEQTVIDQETAYFQALGAAKTYAVSGDKLTFKDSGGKEVAAFAAQSQDLAGTSWEAISYNNGKQAVTSVAAGTMITAEFGKDGNLTGNAGCNNYNATYKVTGNQITLGPVASTKKACEQAVMDQETLYLAALQSASTYQIDGNRLELRTSDGALAADFTKK